MPPKKKSAIARTRKGSGSKTTTGRGTNQGSGQATSKAGNARSTGFSAQEMAAMRERLQELRAQARTGQSKSRDRRRADDRSEGEAAVLAAIAKLPQPDRSIAKKLHALVAAHASELAPRTWYGMPAYARNDNVVCFFQSAQKFKTRYGTLGFSDKAMLDDGPMWPTAYALKQLGTAEEVWIIQLLRKALG